jgi:hypothetical protein
MGIYGFFNRRIRVRAVAKKQVEIVGVEALQCSVASLHYMLAAQARLVGSLPPQILLMI